MNQYILFLKHYFLFTIFTVIFLGTVNAQNSATTDSASIITTNTATLYGHVSTQNGSGGDGWYTFFQYYTDTIGWTHASPIPVTGIPDHYNKNTTNQPVIQNISGLNSNTRYFFRLFINKAAAYIDGLKRNFWTKPDAPVAIAATNEGGSYFTANWNAVSGAGSITYTLVVKRTSDNTIVGAPITGITTTSQLVSTGLTSCTSYYYVVTAVGPGGTSANSNSITVSTTSPQPGGLLPGTGTTCAPLDQALSWSAVTGATSYDLQVATDSQFTTGVQNFAGVAITSQALSGLATGQKYYWHVRTNMSGCSTSPYTAPPNTFTTIPLPPIQVTTTAPIDLASCQLLTPAFNWTAITGMTYEIQYSTDSTFTGANTYTSATNNYTVVTPLSNNTIYYWHIRAKDGCSQTGLWSVNKSFTTVEAAPPQVVTTTPADLAGCQSVAPVFNWDTLTGMTYEIQYSTDPAFTGAPTYTSAVNSYTVITPLNNNVIYYWHVRALDACGQTGLWSVSKSFTTITLTPVQVTTTTPADLATCQILTPVLNWTAITGMTYEIQYSTDNTFTGAATDTSSTNSFTITTPLNNNTVYYWHVRALDGCGQTGSWSTSKRFTTVDPAPPQVITTTPANLAGCQSLAPSLSWNTITGMTYEIQYSTDPAFTGATTYTSAVNSYTVVTPLNNNTLYYWHVRAKDACGQTGLWSVNKIFTTLPVLPAQVVTTIPADLSTCQILTPALNWNTITGMTYEIQYSTDPAFTGAPIYTSAVNSYTVATPLNNNTLYYWHVRALDGCSQTGQWSVSKRFTTLPVLPAQVVTTTPADLAGCQILMPVLNWNSISGMTYEIQYSTDNTFTGAPTYTSATNSYTVASPLNYNTQYYWHVRAKDGCSQLGAWSVNKSFTTMLSLPTITSLSVITGDIVGGTDVTINGSNFIAPVSVTFGGANATNIILVSPTQITCKTPAHAAGAVNVIVQNGVCSGSSFTLVNGFTYYIPALTITAVTPSAGHSTGGDLVTITGTGWGDMGGTFSVSFGGSAATNVTRTGFNSLTCTTPAHATGFVNVTVTRTGTFPWSSQLSDGFMFISIEPSAGSTLGGQTLVLHGTFNEDNQPLTGTYFSMTFGGVPATNVKRQNQHDMVGTTPAVPAGPADVIITYYRNFVFQWSVTFPAAFTFGTLNISITSVGTSLSTKWPDGTHLQSNLSEVLLGDYLVINNPPVITNTGDIPLMYPVNVNFYLSPSSVVLSDYSSTPLLGTATLNFSQSNPLPVGNSASLSSSGLSYLVPLTFAQGDFYLHYWGSTPGVDLSGTKFVLGNPYMVHIQEVSFHITSPGLAKISIPSKRTVEIPVIVDNLNGVVIEKIDLILAYDPAILKYKGLNKKEGSMSGWKINGFENSGYIKIVGEGDRIDKGGTLIKIIFEVIGSPGSQSDLDIRRFIINSNVPVISDNGSIKVIDESASRILEEKGIPDKYTLEQNYPNPFNPSTVINYSLVSDAYVSLAVYDALGRLVAALENGNTKQGYHEVVFNAAKNTSGVYYYVLRITNKEGGKILTKKMILLK